MTVASQAGDAMAARVVESASLLHALPPARAARVARGRGSASFRLRRPIPGADSLIPFIAAMVLCRESERRKLRVRAAKIAAGPYFLLASYQRADGVGASNARQKA
jgi:hypothetical protein